MSPQRLEKMTYAGTTTIFAAINLFKLPSYAAVGMLSAVEPVLFAVMAVVAVSGVVLGKRLSHWLPDRVYRAIIEGLLAVLSVWLMVDGVLKAGLSRGSAGADAGGVGVRPGQRDGVGAAVPGQPGEVGLEERVEPAGAPARRIEGAAADEFPTSAACCS